MHKSTKYKITSATIVTQMPEEADERLKQFLSDRRNWERKATNIPVVFLFRLTASKGRSASLSVEFNPFDAYGSITKKRGMVIRSRLELNEISRLLEHPKVGERSKRIDAVSPKKEGATKGKGAPDIFEI